MVSFKTIFETDVWFTRQLLNRYWTGALVESMHAF